MKTRDLDRREFLEVSALTGVGMLISTQFPTCGGIARSAQSAVTFEPGIYVKIDNLGNIVITVARSEMGQGVHTALPMILAEELEADWSRISVEQAPSSGEYGDQSTGGSRSIQESYLPLRRAGAVAREMLIAAAAQRWNVDPDECLAKNSAVIHRATDRSLSYAELAEIAAELPVPNSSSVPLKEKSEFGIIGTSVGRLNEPEIVRGTAKYGIDTKIPDMSYAVIARCPVIEGSVESFDASAALSIDGVTEVVEISNGVAVVADSTWAAMQGRDALQIRWNEGEYANLSTADVFQVLLERAQSRSNPSQDENTLAAIYELPYLAHASLEPQNCIADVREDRCVVWAPTQNPAEARRQAARTAGLSNAAVEVNVTLLGGGFGRRLEVDYVVEAVEVSKAVGKPVQVIWDREDDMRHDLYHPSALYMASAPLDQPTRYRVVPYRSRELFPAVPTGAWRAVDNVYNAFARESFLHEISSAIGEDHYEFRRSFMQEPHLRVLDLAAEKAGWTTSLPDGWGRGIAFHSTWGVTHVAEVAEVSIAEDQSFRVERVVCAIDCGTVINPDMVRAQVEGGIAFALSAALGEEITIENGSVVQSNFHDYRLLRYDEMPVVEVHIIESDARPEGVGEMGGPPIAAAVANAIFDATGIRIRKLPIGNIESHR